jgi:hypothetical protein
MKPSLEHRSDDGEVDWWRKMTTRDANALWEAYRTTVFKAMVDGRELHIRIDETTPELDDELKRRGSPAGRTSPLGTRGRRCCLRPRMRRGKAG